MVRKNEASGEGAIAPVPAEQWTLRHLRWARGLSLELCANAVGLSVRDFLAKERGRARFTAKEVAGLAILLDVEAEEMLRVVGTGVGSVLHRYVEPAGRSGRLAQS